MFKNIFLILSICILFFGCKSPKKTTEYLEGNNEIEAKIEDNKYKNEKIKTNILDNDAYWESSKRFYIQNMGQVEFLINEFSQDEIAEYIERLEIYFRITKTDLMFLKYFSQLKGLVLRGDTIGSIEAIKYLHNLEELDISSSTIVDISPISDLVSLKLLSLYGLTGIDDISAIANLECLESLSLMGLEKIKDITAVSSLKNLEFLHISDGNSSYYNWNNIENFSPIFDTISLKRLEFFIIERDIANIGKLKNLEYLETFIYNQTELNSLSNLTQLRKLFINQGHFDDVSPLLKLPNLETIRFPINFFVDITMLAKSNSLKLIIMDFGPERWYKFQDNEEKFFYEKGINVKPYDWN